MFDVSFLNFALSLAILAAMLGAVFVFRSLRQQIAIKDRKIIALRQELENHQAQLIKEKSELNTILSSMVEGVIVLKPDGNILYVSPNVCTMLEMRAKDVVSRPYWEVIRHQEILGSIKESLVHKKKVCRTIEIIGLDDAYFDMRIVPVLQEGQLITVVAVFYEITDLKKLLKLRSEFVANVSHELRTPLTSIKGYVETLQEEIKDNSNISRFLEIIHRQTSYLEKLVNDLLLLSSVESKESNLILVRSNLLPLIKDVLGTYQQAIQRAQLELTVEIPNHAPDVSLQEEAITGVLTNLLDNAIKFTPALGKITVRLSYDLTFVRLDIQDTGIGIEQEHLSRIFERFYRVDKARQRKTGGTGLGLSIVKHIVALHQGMVEVKSVPSQGSTFSVFLPVVN